MEEKNQYSIVGKVEIGTDEYRDILTAKFDADNRADRYMREGWDKDKQIKALTAQVEELRGKLVKCENFMKKNMTNFPSDVITMIFAEIGEK